jgi:type I restriction enzyme S subunit
MNEPVPEEWSHSFCGDAVVLQYGRSPKEVICGDGKYPIIGTGGITGYSNEALHDGNTVVIGRKGTINKPSFISGKFWAIDTTYYASAYLDTEPKWFFYTLQNTDLLKYNEASGVPSLNRDTLYSIPLTVPPLPEQQKIAAILTSVDNVIESTQAQINKLQDLKTGMMQELLAKGIGHSEFKDSPVGRIPVGWEVRSAGELCRSIVPGRNKPTSMGGGIPWLTINDIEDVYTSKSKLGYGVTREILADAKGKTVPANSVIMSCVGEFGIASIACTEVVINQQLHAFICGKLVIPEFLCLVLRTKSAEMMKLATQTTIAYMNKTNCEAVLIPVPPLKEQKRIADTLLTVYAKLGGFDSKLACMNSLKKALMQDLLTGKVRVKTD